MHNDQKLVGMVKAWRERAEDMMRLPVRSAGSREMRVNADQLLKLISEFEKLGGTVPAGQGIGASLTMPEHSAS